MEFDFYKEIILWNIRHYLCMPLSIGRQLRNQNFYYFYFQECYLKDVCVQMSVSFRKLQRENRTIMVCIYFMLVSEVALYIYGHREKDWERGRQIILRIGWQFWGLESLKFIGQTGRLVTHEWAEAAVFFYGSPLRNFSLGLLDDWLISGHIRESYLLYLKSDWLQMLTTSTKYHHQTLSLVFHLIAKYYNLAKYTEKSKHHSI